MVKWKLDKNWFNLVVHVLGLNEVIIATESGFGYVFLKKLDQLHFFRDIGLTLHMVVNLALSLKCLGNLELRVKVVTFWRFWDFQVCLEFQHLYDKPQST